MNRFIGLWRDTWWVWLIFFVIGLFASLVLSRVFWITFPVCIFAFLYFGAMRYDENGNEKEM